MIKVEILKKFNRLNPLELSATIVGFLLVTLICLFSFLVYFDDFNGGFVSNSHVNGGLKWWFGVNATFSENGYELVNFEISNNTNYNNTTQCNPKIGCDSNTNNNEKEEEKGECNYYDGKWVWDEKYPLYDSKDCSFIDGGFRCSENGRPDNSYTKWRWQPNKCNLPRFDAKLMLEKLRNKRLVFVGDSIGRNQWESLLCMLSSAVSNKSSIYEANGNPITKHMGSLVFKFDEYNCTIEYYRAPFLVVQGRPPYGSPQHVRYSLKVDRLDWSSDKWKGADVLIFNAGHWWTYDKTVRSGCYFEEGNTIQMNMTVETAFKRSIQTLLSWIDTQIDVNVTSVFFRSYAPVHFSGGDWKTGGTCHLQTMPDLKAPYMPQTWGHYNIVNDVLSEHANKTHMKKMNVLDVTYMTLQRRDGHSSLYYLGPVLASIHRQDCSHWCLPGIPDTWNELLYAAYLKQELLRSKNLTEISQVSNEVR